MEQLLRDILSGSASGAIYALIACSLVLTYATTGIFNLGYAGISFSAAFVFYELRTGLGWPAPIAAAVVILIYCPLIGLLLDKAVFRRLAHASQAAQLVASIGVLLALPAMCTFFVGRGIDFFGWHLPRGDPSTDALQVPGVGPHPAKVYHLMSGVIITSDQLIVLGAAAACAGLLFVFLRLTRTGLRMRAVADRAELASLREINGTRTSQLAWVLGSVLAGIAGVAGAPILGSLNPDSYSLAMFVAIAAAVIGGFRSAVLAFVGAIVVTVLGNIAFSNLTFTQSIPGFNSTLPFVVLLAGLLLMATRRRRVAGSISAEPPSPNYQRDLPAWRRLLPSLIGTGLLMYGVFSLFGSFWLNIVTRGLIFSLIFLSFTIVTGIGGMVSLAQAAFVTGSGLVVGLLTDHYGVEWWVALLCAVLVSTALGVLVALPSLRLGGVALALATLALAFAGGQVLFQINWLRNSNLGWQIARPKLGPFDLNNTRTMAVFIFILIGLVLWVIKTLERSTTGREMLAVRNAEAAAASIGVSPTVTKLKVFALSSAVAGLGGGLLATYDQVVGGSSITPLSGLIWLAPVVLLGVRRPSGAIVAGLSTVLTPALLRGFTLPFGIGVWSGSQASEVPAILFGLGAIALARQPDGVFQDIAKKNFERRQRRRLRNQPGVDEAWLSTSAESTRAGEPQMSPPVVR